MRVLFIFVLLSNLIFAQTDANPEINRMDKNHIDFNAGWSIVAYGIALDYERLLPSKKRNMYSSFSIGAGLYEINFFTIDQYFVPSFQYGIVTGLESKHHFEAKAGFSLPLNRRPLRFDDYDVLPNIKIGYRYQAPKEHFLFKAGAGFPDLLFGISYISLHYNSGQS